jgi:GTP-binding protein HflX
MSRQRGGSYGAKGSGETQLELDKRDVQNKIIRLQTDLEKVRRIRSTVRKKRERVLIPTCALVGYTNAGKSSLLNALTGATVLTEDKLFATLDPTTRRYPLRGGSSVLLTDTVGFISNLPHLLVDAFRATLEEALVSDLLLVVLDAADPAIRQQYQTVMAVLADIGAADKRKLILLNKYDLTTGMLDIAALRQTFPDAMPISAKTGDGFAELGLRIEALLLGKQGEYFIPPDRQDLLPEIRKTGSIISVSWEDAGIRICALVQGKTESLLEPYKVH